LGVPGQGVAAHLHAVAGGPVVDRITCAEIELVLVRLGGVDLQLVLGRDHVELTRRDGGVSRVTELAVGDGSAVVAARAGSGGAERGGLRLGGGEEKALDHGNNHCQNKDPQEHFTSFGCSFCGYFYSHFLRYGGREACSMS